REERIDRWNESEEKIDRWNEREERIDRWNESEERDTAEKHQSANVAYSNTPKTFHQTAAAATTSTTATKVWTSYSSSTDSTRLVESHRSNPQTPQILKLKSIVPGRLEEQVVLKASLGREVHLVRRAHSQVDMSSVSGRLGRPPLLKRKISMP
ncbi:hypothetical protein EGW08_008724, partial [Elysia chlorotica]